MWRSVLRLLRGALPAVLVATLIPLGLFYVVLSAGTVFWAIAMSVVYAYGVAAYQWARRGRVSGMLLMTVFMATVKAATAVISGRAFMFFAVPVVETAGFGLMFLATMFSGEPLVVRLARDLVPDAADGLAARRSLVRTLSLVWTTVYVASGATTMVLLTTVPLPVFLGAHTLTGWFWTGSGAVATFAVCRRRAAGLLSELLQPPAGAGRRAAGPAGPLSTAPLVA